MGIWICQQRASVSSGEMTCVLTSNATKVECREEVDVGMWWKGMLKVASLYVGCSIIY
jgi:hypothetical protein